MWNSDNQKQKGFTPTPTLLLLRSVFEKVGNALINFEKKYILPLFLRPNKNTTAKLVSGFTLVELLVAVAVFMIVVTAAVGALYSIIDANRKAQSMKSVINNVSFALESISKDMRMGNSYNCNSANPPYEDLPECPALGSKVISYFSDQKNKKIWYQFTTSLNDGEGNIQRKIDDGPWQSLTAPENTVKINNMVFYVLGNKDPLSQSRVLITVEGESGTKESSKTNFSLQTTVSQRTQKQL